MAAEGAAAPGRSRARGPLRDPGPDRVRAARGHGRALGLPVAGELRDDRGRARSRACRSSSPTALRATGSAGPPAPGVELRILGEDDTDVPPGTVGEILVRQPAHVPRLPRHARGHRRALPRRLDLHGRPGHARRERIRVGRRAQEGHDPAQRREHQRRRGGGRCWRRTAACSTPPWSACPTSIMARRSRRSSSSSTAPRATRRRRRSSPGSARSGSRRTRCRASCSSSTSCRARRRCACASELLAAQAARRRMGPRELRGGADGRQHAGLRGRAGDDRAELQPRSTSVVGFANFAHGEFITFGAFLGVAQRDRMPLAAAVVCGAVGTGLLAVLLSVGVFQRFPRSSIGTLMIVSAGVAIALRGVIQAFFGVDSRRFDEPTSSVSVLGDDRDADPHDHRRHGDRLGARVRGGPALHARRPPRARRRRRPRADRGARRARHAGDQPGVVHLRRDGRPGRRADRDRHVREPRDGHQPADPDVRRGRSSAASAARSARSSARRS